MFKTTIHRLKMTLCIQKLECFKAQDSLLSIEAHFSFNIYKIVEAIRNFHFVIYRITSFFNLNKKVLHLTTIDRGKKLGTILTQAEHRQIVSNIQKLGKISLYVFDCLKELLSNSLKNINHINMLEACRIYLRMVKFQSFNFKNIKLLFNYFYFS